MYKIKFFLLVFFLFFQSCTISFNNTSTSGRAEDIIDQDQDASPNVSPNVSLPISAM